METKKLVLIVEDEAPICHFMTTVLSANGYRVVSTGKGLELPSLASSHCPDIVLLDLGLPDVDGIEALRSFREWCDIPVVIVSARGGEKDKVSALDLGADDYVTKPFGTAELLARIRAAIRHRVMQQGAVVESSVSIAGLSIDFDRMRVSVDDNDIHLTPIEFRIIELLTRHRGKVLTHAMILKSVWGPYFSDTQTLRVNMANIRRKIETNPAEPRYIRTEIGVGYRMAED
jgi:two-component system KDP operon response regulator KdpE